MRYAVSIPALIACTVFVPGGFAQNAAPNALKTLRPVVSLSEDGPPLQGGEAFQSGEEVFFSFQTENYKVGTTGKIQLTGHIEAFDPRGTPIAPADEVVIGTSVSQEDKDWKPKLRSQIQLPSIAPPGNYTIKYNVTDLQTKQIAVGEMTFAVRGRNVPESPVLTVRGLGFYRTQDDETALKVPAYRPGDIMWVRFDITGFKHGEQNAIDVTYDVAVLTGDGKQLFSQENAAVEKSQAFYPQPWVPAEFNLSLQTTMSLGTYTVMITAHDGIGAGQTATAKADFRVEK